MNLKNLEKCLSINQNIIIFRDYGSINCAEVLFKKIKNKKKNILFTHNILRLNEKKIIEKKLSGYIIRNNFLFFYYLLFKKKNIIILQSSNVIKYEKFIKFFFQNYFVIQDYIGDFKYGSKPIYLTSFTYDEKQTIQKTITLPYMRPQVIDKKKYILDEKSLLILGARNLITKKNNTFLSKLYSMNKYIKIFYKPHPSELIDIDKNNYLKRLDFELFEFENVNKIPKYIISPFSSLGFDLPEQTNLDSNSFIIYHGFGNSYDKKHFDDPNWQLHVSNKSVNYFKNDFNLFLQEIKNNV